jgi:hypothetical protein
MAIDYKVTVDIPPLISNRYCSAGCPFYRIEPGVLYCHLSPNFGIRGGRLCPRPPCPRYKDTPEGRAEATIKEMQQESKVDPKLLDEEMTI